MNFLQQSPPDEPVITVDIPDVDTKQQASAEIVCLTYPDAVRRVAPFQFVSIDQACLRPHPVQQQGSSVTSYWLSPSV